MVASQAAIATPANTTALAIKKESDMPGYCGKCEKYYSEHGLDHIENCEGRRPGVVSGSLEDYHQQTGDTGLIQAPEGFDWNEALRSRDKR